MKHPIQITRFSKSLIPRLHDPGFLLLPGRVHATKESNPVNHIQHHHSTPHSLSLLVVSYLLDCSASLNRHLVGQPAAALEMMFPYRHQPSISALVHSLGPQIQCWWFIFVLITFKPKIEYTLNACCNQAF